MSGESLLHYVDILPERVSAREVYTYTIKLRSNADTQLATGANEPDRPLGEISIDIPYDGNEYFSPEAAEQLRKQIEPWSGAAVDGQIGWLAIGKPPDWEHEWNSQPGMDQHPVQIPLLNSILTDPGVWTADTFRAVVRHKYDPEAPIFVPLRMEMQVYDNAQDSRERPGLKRGSMLELIERAKGIPGMLEILDGEPLQGGQLVIALSISASLPAFMVSDDLRVTISQWKFKWPTIAPDWHIKIHSLNPDEDISWRYNPDDQTVELALLSAQRGEPEPGSLLVPFSRDLLLTLDSPGQVISQDELEGSLQLCIHGCLLSGRQVGWLDVSGKRLEGDADLLDVRTILNVRFIATLSDRFRQRRTAAYRQWYLAGVRLSSARLDDIAAALRDMGYRISDESGLLTINPKRQNNEAAIEIGVVLGQRYRLSQNQEPALLDIAIWALPVSPAATSRKREISEGGEVSTTWDTNDLILQVRGQMSGAGSLLGLDMDELMNQLKSRFSAVADLR